MKNKNRKHIFWQSPLFSITLLITVLIFAAFIIFLTIRGLRAEYMDWAIWLILYVPSGSIFALFSFCGFRLAWLRVVIDPEKIVVKFLSGKTLTECRIDQIVEVQIRQMQNAGLYIVIKNSRSVKTSMMARRNRHVAIRYSKEKEALLKTYWDGNIEWLD